MSKASDEIEKLNTNDAGSTVEIFYGAAVHTGALLYLYSPLNDRANLELGLLKCFAA